MLQSQMLICAASSASFRLSSFRIAARSARRRSWMTALRSMSGVDTKMRNSWMDIALSRGTLPMKGPSRCMAPQIASSATVSVAVLAPRGPKRAAAQTRNGRGAYSRAAMLSGPVFCQVKTGMLTPRSPMVSATSSAMRPGERRRRAARSRRAHATIIGTSVSSASRFEKKRDRQMPQYVPSPQPTSVTKPASRKHDRDTPTVQASTKTPTWRESSSRSAPLVSRRIKRAPISASEQLLTNHPRSIGTGTPFASCMATWAGSAASRRIHQDRVGARSSAARRMELGGQSVEMGYGWSFSANPIFAPRKYPAQTRSGARIIGSRSPESRFI